MEVLDILKDYEEGQYGTFKEYEYVECMTGFRMRYLIYFEDGKATYVDLGAA